MGKATAVTDELGRQAERVRTVKLEPSEVAALDQNTSEWTEAFRTLGIRIDDPATARAAFATATCMLWHFIDACETHDGSALKEFGERLIGSSQAFAAFV